MIQFLEVKLGDKPEETIRCEVSWEKDEDAPEDQRFIASCAEFVAVVTGPSIRMTENRLEMKVREQIAIMKAHGRFRGWLNKKLGRKDDRPKG